MKDYWDITDYLYVNATQPSAEDYRRDFQNSRTLVAGNNSFVQDLVYLRDNSTLIASMFSTFIDNDIWSVNYTALGDEVYLKPIFRSYQG